MFGWLKRRKLRLIGTSKWRINWSDAAPDEGIWLYYESLSGRRKVETSYIPWVYKGMGGATRLPGHGPALAWSQGGSLPSTFTSVKEME